MVLVDYVIIILLIISIVSGIVRGIIRDAVSLASWICAFWISFNFAEAMTASWPITLLGDSERIRLVAAFIALFFLVLMIGWLCGWILAKLVSRGRGKLVDHFLGAFFGLARGILVMVLFVLLLNPTSLPQSDWWRTSALLDEFQQLALQTKSFMPVDVSDYFVSESR